MVASFAPYLTSALAEAVKTTIEFSVGKVKRQSFHCFCLYAMLCHMQNAILVETVGAPAVGTDLTPWHGNTLTAGEAKPAHEEEV
jgi:hypothetical protein